MIHGMTRGVVAVDQTMNRFLFTLATKKKNYNNIKTAASTAAPHVTITSKFLSSTPTPAAATTASTTAAATATTIPPPTRTQLRNHFIANGLPMVGFGIMDQTVMIQAGNMIDCTIGVTLGLSTLTAAAVGGLLSNLSGVLFGGTLENLAKAWGLPASNLTSDQRALSFVKRGRLASQAIGIFLGCSLGLLNILLIDTERSSSLKLLHKSEEEEFAFEVEVSNDEREDATVLTVRGPDVDGVLAGITAALTLNGCSLLEVRANSTIVDIESDSGSESSGDADGKQKYSSNAFEDTFVIVDQETKEKIRDEDLEQLCRVILDASKEGPNLLKFQLKELEDKNTALQARVNSLETALLKRRISVRPSGKGIVRG
mmetsp:Transcript_6742/g.10245  ORF Transcript_6742/g.10245 Transcript_6742/m.10245 type:complete len:372 (-) Transcript_6742:215-1330(-)|eukprot:CAMPEP_0203678928 /NCGR_PEP_ID=MMETSP0090-20130426/33684_1 /ASSEMBLY_ACC=CAM_ASM_001088 /TAXON_ID=426623 /ORGANISM="Chaetoceros affinis, Strain CCMP159" /LENGTH=371 /DNA_ID=CAMNT_0050546371 /DNA_START=129 /DNA_END=1244 /DNA_ORIENTATION=+